MSQTALPPQSSTRTDSPPAGPRAGRRVPFFFEGRRLEGVEGESVAKALFDNGIRTLSRSVKYGRPRGIHCGRGRCSMCLVEVDGFSGVKSCVTPLAAGMRIRRQNYKPAYGSLMTAVMRRIPFPAGFYYRMFTRPRPVREAFVGTIRRLAGVGRIDVSARPAEGASAANDLARIRPRYDVVVVGAGISGLAAARGAAQTGADVLLVDEYLEPGGHHIGPLGENGMAAARDDLIRWAGGEPVETAMGVTAQGFYPPDRLMLARGGLATTRGAVKLVEARAFVLATGAQDLVPLFENNDLPGVFGPRALRLFLERDGLAPGRSAVVYGTAAQVADAVALASAHGIGVAAVVSPDPTVAGLPPGVRSRGGAVLAAAEGRDWIERAVFSGEGGNRFSVPCDLLCLAVPGQPAFELAQHAGFSFSLGEPGGRAGGPDLRVMAPTADEIDGDGGAYRRLVGEAAGRFEWRSMLEHAAATGVAAARRR